MEFNFNINSVLQDEISIFDNSTIHQMSRKSHQNFRHQLETIINEIGYRSAKAQNLPGIITTLSKLLINQQRIYILKDNEANDGEGLVIGFLKTGHKNLFLIDHDGKHNEETPLCVLDFYVHETQQRRGCGLKLFNAMLKNENVDPVQLAIDRPSNKFLSFLRKHFKLWATIPQTNNFVIFDGYFRNRRKPTRRHWDVENQPWMSRTASDDIIKRNRLKNGTPTRTHGDMVSRGSPLTGLALNHTTIRTDFKRRKGNNLYSRYSSAAPQIGRTTTVTSNNYYNQPYHGDYAVPSTNSSSEDGNNRHTNVRSPESTAAASPQNLNNGNKSTVSSPEPAHDGKDVNMNHKQPELHNDSKYTKFQVNSHARNDGYNSPAKSATRDLIAELKMKDSTALNSNSGYTPHMKQRAHLANMYSSSWNVLGIPPLHMKR